VKILKKKRKYENGNEILRNENINGNIIGFYGGTSVEKGKSVPLNSEFSFHGLMSMIQYVHQIQYLILPSKTGKPSHPKLTTMESLRLFEEASTV
jgi:hypothetical protein